MKFVDYATRDQMMPQVAERIAADLTDCLARQPSASLAVPGGTTPGPVFDSLSKIQLDWARVQVMLTDERWVLESSERSNTALIRQRLMTGQAVDARFVPFYTGHETPEEALSEIETVLAPTLPLAVLLLGMGADMHTASLFPGADRLTDGLSSTAPSILPMRAPGAPEPRLTLTAPVLTAATTTHILITGAEKRDAINAAAELSPEQAPIKIVLDTAIIHWAP